MLKVEGSWALQGGIGLDDLQKSLPTLAILGLWDLSVVYKGKITHDHQFLSTHLLCEINIHRFYPSLLEVLFHVLFMILFSYINWELAGLTHMYVLIHLNISHEYWSGYCLVVTKVILWFYSYLLFFEALLLIGE